MNTRTPKLKMQYCLQSLKKTKYLVLNLTKHGQNLYSENYQTLISESIERHATFLDCKTQHSRYVNSPPVNI